MAKRDLCQTNQPTFSARRVSGFFLQLGARVLIAPMTRKGRAMALLLLFLFSGVASAQDYPVSKSPKYYNAGIMTDEHGEQYVMFVDMNSKKKIDKNNFHLTIAETYADGRIYYNRMYLTKEPPQWRCDRGKHSKWQAVIPGTTGAQVYQKIFGRKPR